MKSKTDDSFACMHKENLFTLTIQAKKQENSSGYYAPYLHNCSCFEIKNLSDW